MRRNTSSSSTLGRTLSTYASNASPTSCGSGRPEDALDFPDTMSRARVRRCGLVQRFSYLGIAPGEEVCASSCTRTS